MNSVGSGNLYSGAYFVQDGYTNEQKEELIVDAYSDLTVFHASSLLDYDIPINVMGRDVEVKELMGFIMMLPTESGMSIKDSKVIAMMLEMLMTRHNPDRAAFSLNGLTHVSLTEALGDHGRYTEAGVKAILRVLRHTQIHQDETYLSLELMCVFAEHALKHCQVESSKEYLREIPYATLTMHELQQYKNDKNIREKQDV